MNTASEVRFPLIPAATNSVAWDTETQPIRSILVATDLSSSSHTAVVHGIEIARKYDAMLHFVHVVSALGYTFGGREVMHRATQVACRSILDLETKLGSSGVLEKVRSLFWVRQGEVATEVEELARQENADLIVVGTNCPRGLSHLVLGSGERIFRWTERPVLTVNANISRRPFAGNGVQHVLFATDFSEASTKALHYAASLSSQFSAPLTALHVVENHPKIRPLSETDWIEASLRRLRNMPFPERSSPLDVRFAVQTGDVADVILRAAKLNPATVIVMGLNRAKLIASAAHSRSIAHSVVSGAQCPILTVRA